MCPSWDRSKIQFQAETENHRNDCESKILPNFQISHKWPLLFLFFRGFFCSVTTIKFMSERGQGFVGIISHLMITINSQSIVNRDRASVTWRVCTAMHHKPQFTCSFVASGAADPFLGVLMGVTWTTRKEKKTSLWQALFRNTQINLWEDKKRFTWTDGWVILLKKRKTKKHPSGSATSWPQSWCHGKRNAWFQIKQKPFLLQQT